VAADLALVPASVSLLARFLFAVFLSAVCDSQNKQILFP
jgi:hypothetical protein